MLKTAGKFFQKALSFKTPPSLFAGLTNLGNEGLTGFLISTSPTFLQNLYMLDFQLHCRVNQSLFYQALPHNNDYANNTSNKHHLGFD
ncbi:hypothetical protein [Pasteurella multocida]|uniref:hypothetical protein n=1 Tax=Pasteurella multocida TaxID=747 RepID=UPI0020234594|nr:hypothetical protein [Pasteurella multocida]URH96730.1 hypothetical protein M8855_02310 [Pasteurella multocida]